MKKELTEKLNFFATAFVGVLGISLASEIFMEDDFEDKLDDAVLLGFGLFAIWWYRKKGKNASPYLSVWFLGISLLTKFVAIAIEHADKEAVGDDFGIASALIIALIFVAWNLFKLRKAK